MLLQGLCLPKRSHRKWSTDHSCRARVEGKVRFGLRTDPAYAAILAYDNWCHPEIGPRSFVCDTQSCYYGCHCLQSTISVGYRRRKPGNKARPLLDLSTSHSQGPTLALLTYTLSSGQYVLYLTNAYHESRLMRILNSLLTVTS